MEVDAVVDGVAGSVVVVAVDGADVVAGAEHEQHVGLEGPHELLLRWLKLQCDPPRCSPCRLVVG